MLKIINALSIVILLALMAVLIFRQSHKISEYNLLNKKIEGQKARIDKFNIKNGIIDFAVTIRGSKNSNTSCRIYVQGERPGLFEMVDIKRGTWIRGIKDESDKIQVKVELKSEMTNVEELKLSDDISNIRLAVISYGENLNNDYNGTDLASIVYSNWIKIK